MASKFVEWDDEARDAYVWFRKQGFSHAQIMEQGMVATKLAKQPKGKGLNFNNPRRWQQRGNSTN